MTGEVPTDRLLNDRETLWMWTVYERPSDHPDKFVARKWGVRGGVRFATSDMFTADTLEEVRALLPPFLHRLERFAQDDPSIVEVWL